VADPYVRILEPDEYRAAARVVGQGMLASVADEVVDAWIERWKPEECHGAFTADDVLVGVARWFRDEVSVPGESLPVAGITAVAVLSTHRRQGHLRRLMGAQLDHIRAAGVPMATLVAAEWPIYGRFGYGPAMDACAYEVDSASARFHDARTGTIELVTPAELRPHLEAVHALRWARGAGSLRRTPAVWDHLAGLTRWPNDPTDPGMLRGALWRDDAGEVRGAVAYKVSDTWVHNRPAGKAETIMLVGETPEAERELWRHLCEIDWATTVVGSLRAVDDPLPLFLADGRAAAQVERSDAIWARILDVPAAFAARRAPVAGRAVLEVDDALGHAAGRWAIELGRDAGCATETDEAAEVRLSAGALAAVYFGGHSPRRLADAGWVTELVPGAVDRLSTLLATPQAPWSTTSY
jgi:predicted acetyltransferase